MNGLFQRIPRRGTDRPDDTSAPETVDGAAGDAQARPQDAEPVSAPHSEQPTAPAPSSEATAPFTPLAAQTAILPAAASPAPVLAPADGDVQAPVPDARAPMGAAAPERRPGFRERGRMRRRLRYLRRLRELQVRDLGGLAFDLRRFERTRDDLLAQKIDQIRACDDELRSLEAAIEERRDVRDVRAPGIGGTCPRCFALYGSSDRFCSSCGAALGGAVQGPAQVHQPALGPTEPPQPSSGERPQP